MSQPVIRVQGLGKKYRLYAAREKYYTLRDSLARAATAPVRMARRLSGSNGHVADSSKTFWALRDISFEVPQGEVLAIIGRNGAGKSTLLKVLSRITEPTEGYAELRGRVGSLLEVGTGFHPELSGRENIYMNGAILGMKRRDVDRRFDEIVAFAEVEKFVDTPVKHYSSGMYLRLAFAVAAHLEPEILLVDEVLAVGDAAFQKKCLGKMENVAAQGRTVLFVSHNMQAIKRLCTSACVFDNGELIARCEPESAIRVYLDNSQLSTSTFALPLNLEDVMSIDDLQVLQDGKLSDGYLDNLSPVEVVVRYRLQEQISGLLLGFDLVSPGGDAIFRTYDMQAYGMGIRLPGCYDSTCQFPPGIFQTGDYHLNFVAGIHRNRWLSRNSISVRLSFGGPKLLDVDFPGILRPLGEWSIYPAIHSP